MKSDDLAGFSKNLRKLRVESGLSQIALANLIGTSNTTICRYENGSQAPTRYHRAMLAKVFGVPGYYLFDEDYISVTHTPEATIKDQEKLRLAMLLDDFEYVELVAYRLHTAVSDAYKKPAIVQIKNYLICWSFFRQGAKPDDMLAQMISCIQLTRPGMTVDDMTCDPSPDAPLSYVEIQIINAIGVILVRRKNYIKASRIFGMLIRKTDSDMLECERRIFRKITLALNLSTALRFQGLAKKGEELLMLYSESSFHVATGLIGLMLLVGLYKCMDRHSDVYRIKKRRANMLYSVLSHEFGLKKSLAEVEKYVDDGLMVL